MYTKAINSYLCRFLSEAIGWTIKDVNHTLTVFIGGTYCNIYTKKSSHKTKDWLLSIVIPYYYLLPVYGIK
jgi:hypothetical protein